MSSLRYWKRTAIELALELAYERERLRPLICRCLICQQEATAIISPFDEAELRSYVSGRMPAGKLGGALSSGRSRWAAQGRSRKANRKSPRPRLGRGFLIEKGVSQLRAR